MNNLNVCNSAQYGQYDLSLERHITRAAEESGERVMCVLMDTPMFMCDFVICVLISRAVWCIHLLGIPVFAFLARVFVTLMFYVAYLSIYLSIYLYRYIYIACDLVCNVCDLVFVTLEVSFVVWQLRSFGNIRFNF